MRTKLSHINIARDRSHSFHRSTGLPYHDLYGVAILTYIKILDNNTFDPSKGTKFSSYLYGVINNALITYSKKTDCPKEMPKDFHETQFTLLNPRRTVQFIRAIQGMSEEARYIVHLVLDNPHHLIITKPSEKVTITRGSIKKYLKHSGWAQEKISNHIKEIKLTLRSLEV